MFRKNKTFQKAALQVVQEAQNQGLITSLQGLRFQLRLRLDGDLAEQLLSAVVPSVCAYLGVDATKFGKETDTDLFKLDPEMVKEWLNLILQYLPEIIALIKDIFQV